MDISKDTAKQLIAISKHLHKTPENLIEELVDIEFYRVFIKPAIEEYNRQSYQEETKP